MLTALLRSDSAPVYILASRIGDATLSSNKTILPYYPPLKVSRPSISLVERSSSIPTTARKLLFPMEEEIARTSGMKISSNSSAHKSSSRSFSRLSFEDSYDDLEFSGPFVVDDDDTMDPSSSSSFTLVIFCSNSSVNSCDTVGPVASGPEIWVLQAWLGGILITWRHLSAFSRRTN
ncbi:hypothetical protein R6Q59_013675 [Mikania micrantha]